MNGFVCRLFLACTVALAMCHAEIAQAESTDTLLAEVNRSASELEAQVIEWRRDFHANPELSNREFRTAKIVADYLESLGMQVRRDVAHTGVVAVLRGVSAEPVVALRADMDALPVTEETGLPFASTVRDDYDDQRVGVMHACGHDAHTAILMGAATVLALLQNQLPGTVKFIFQPAEEGAPPGENGGAEIMIEQGALENPRPSAIFGLHAIPDFEVGQIAYRSGGMMASSDRLRVRVTGKQTHGAKPWLGVDPIVVSAEIIMGLQTITSRQVDVTLAPSIVTVGSIHGGVRYNIIPDDVEMLGTIRAFDNDMRQDIHRRVERTVRAIAESAGASAETTIDQGNPVTFNDPTLTSQMAPTLVKVVGADNTIITQPHTWAEDFAFYQQVIPGLYIMLGVRTKGADPSEFAPNHSPHFLVDEDALVVGVRALSYLAIDYLAMAPR